MSSRSELPDFIIQARPMVCIGLTVLLIGNATSSAHAGPIPPETETFDSSVVQISPELGAQMAPSTWRPGCPLRLEQLRLVRLRHYDFAGRVIWGEMIVHQEVATDIVAIFHELFEAQFPIERMRLLHLYGGSDDLSVADNNTAAFNCRPVTGRPGSWSKHSYGRAVDLNPLVNPYLKRGVVIPPAGRDYLDRDAPHKGLIRKDEVAYRAFATRGWSWGGLWRSLKDYQHFEAPVAAKPRRPRAPDVEAK